MLLNIIQRESPGIQRCDELLDRRVLAQALQGDDLSSAVTGSHSNAAIPNAPPPPPAAPAAPARTFMVDSSSPPEKPAGTPSMGNVFAQLNQGEAVTKGLKKVQDSAKVHKNPDLRALPSGATIRQA